MPSIVEMSASGLGVVKDDIIAMFEAIEGQIKPLREEFLRRGVILPIPASAAQANPSVITVDGARIVEELAGADIVMTCAVAAEGISGAKSFPVLDDAPKLLWQGVTTNHQASVNDMAGALMCLQEMILLEHPDVLDHDIRIIDGSWTSALLSVLHSWLSSSGASDFLNSFLAEGINGEKFTYEQVADSVLRRMCPWDYADEPGIMVALAKSDSNSAYGRFLARYGVGDDVYLPALTDRMLTMATLRPGEMMAVTPMTTNHLLMGTSEEASDAATPRVLAAWHSLARQKGVMDPDTFDEIAAMYTRLADAGVYAKGSASRLASPALARQVRESWMWTSYFKPHGADANARPMRFDFARPAALAPKMDGTLDIAYLGEVNAYAADVASMLCNDTTPGIKELVSQYLADREAKKLSTAARMMVDSLIANATGGLMTSAILGRYRT